MLYKNNLGLFLVWVKGNTPTVMKSRNVTGMIAPEETLEKSYGNIADKRA
jgi:hypothetical protein